MRKKGDELTAEPLDLYDGRDPRELPVYSFHEVALSLRVAESTLRAWTRGQPGFVPLFPIPRYPAGIMELSFYNLIESYVVVQLRRRHALPMYKIRHSIEYLQDVTEVAHPIIKTELVIFNGDLYAGTPHRRINISSLQGQRPLEQVIRALLTRVDKGPFGVERFYPEMPNKRGDISPRYKPIVVDPEVSFGRPCLAGTGIPTEVIAQRRRAGDSVRAIAEDYYTTVTKVRQAIAFEEAPQRAKESKAA